MVRSDELVSLWLARHGEAANSLEERYGGIADFPLTATGIQQADKLAAHAKTIGIKAVITSPLRRARQTADIVADSLKTARTHVIEDLVEWNSYGVLSGLTRDEAKALFPQIMNHVQGCPEEPGVYLQGAEGRSQFIARVERAFRVCLEIVRQAPAEPCLVVGHGKFLQVLTTAVLHASGVLSYAPSGLNRLDYQGPIARLTQSQHLSQNYSTEPRSMKIYLVRHGEAEDDLDDSYGGAADHALTPNGENQARALASSLAGKEIDHIYTSPQRRAARTAEIIANKLGKTEKLQVIDGLRERNSYGVLSGIPKSRAHQLFPLILKPGEIRSGFSKEPLLGAEDFTSFVERVSTAFLEIVKNASASDVGTIAVVSHGTWLKALLGEHLGLEIPKDWAHASTILLEYFPAKAVVMSA
jgi:broad specificity phosphatase PhoE